MTQAQVSVDRESIAAICRQNGVARLLMFGSVLRSDFEPDRSDVDLLVEFAPGQSRSLFKLVSMQDALRQIFQREVDLTTPGSLSKYFRDDVLSSAVVLYDAA